MLNFLSFLLLPIIFHAQEIKIAFWNILTHHITDSSRNSYEKYHWKNRIHPMIDLIVRDHPDVLGICEASTLQAADLRESLKPYQYKIAAYSAATHQSLEEVEASFASGTEVYYCEFVGFLYNSQRLELKNVICHELEKGEKHPRVLVQGDFFDKIQQIDFSVFASHFDHLSMESIRKSGEMEIALLQDLEDRKIPWFSVGDKNWPFDERYDPSFEQAYRAPYFIADFQEDSVPHYGPKGTFPGHLWLEKDSLPDLKNTPTIDKGFYSRSLIEMVASYTLSGEFNPQSYELLKMGEEGDCEERNLASDHYYIGGVFTLNPALNEGE